MTDKKENREKIDAKEQFTEIMKLESNFFKSFRQKCPICKTCKYYDAREKLEQRKIEEGWGEKEATEYSFEIAECYGDRFEYVSYCPNCEADINYITQEQIDRIKECPECGYDFFFF